MYGQLFGVLAVYISVQVFSSGAKGSINPIGQGGGGGDSNLLQSLDIS